jgi:iron(III) transport system substrate-binding protein
MTPFQRGTLFINPTLVQPNEIRSYRDLLDPKWRGRMVMNDPRRAGPGLATFTFFYLHPDLGPDFIRALGRQEITIMRNFQQEVDAVGQGRFAILIGTADAIAEERIRQGVPVHIVDPGQIREGSDVSPANGNVAMFNRAPHPNAAKVYINWLLSKEGQTEFSRAAGYVSARADVPTDHALPWRVPAPGAIKTYDLKAVGMRDEVVTLLEEIFGPA